MLVRSGMLGRVEPLDAFAPETWRFLSAPPRLDAFAAPDELDALLERWRAEGVRIEPLGRSRAGATIRAAVFGQGERTLLAYGYPHPDEPLGAQTLVWLGERLAHEGLAELADWRVVLVLCADPDGAARNAAWLAAPSLEGFAAGVWRPSHLGLEVEHGFPLVYPPYFADEPFFQGACRSRAECVERCGPGGCRHVQEPFAPLPESRALALALARFRPQVVAAMHSSLCSGDFTFLLERERDGLLDLLVALPAALGSVRALGEPVDGFRGRRLRRGAPDLGRERPIGHFVARLLRRPGYDPDYAYLRQHSAGAVVSALLPGSQFVTPEAGLFRDPAFADTTVVIAGESCLISVEDRRRGRYRIARIETELGWVVAAQEPTSASLAAPEELPFPLSRGMLGVRALVRRRVALAAADRIWAQVSALEGLVEHPWAEERARIKVPGAFVHDHAMRLFRVAAEYQRPPTVAEQASFAWSWPMQTIALLAGFRGYLAVQDRTRPEIAAADAALAALQAEQAAGLPASLQAPAPTGPALASQLARVLLLCAARNG